MVQQVHTRRCRQMRMLWHYCVLFLTAVLSEKCPTSISFLEWQGKISSSPCEVETSATSTLLCSFECADNMNCLAFNHQCDIKCTCQICLSIRGIDFQAKGSFFIRRRDIIYNPPRSKSLGDAKTWHIGRLYPGHVTEFVFEIDLKNIHVYPQMLALQMSDTVYIDGSEPFAVGVIMDLHQGGTKRMSSINESVDEQHEPFFHFVPTDPLYIVILTDSSDFKIYINRVLYCTFTHRFKELDKIQYLTIIPFVENMLKKLSF